MYFIPSDVTAPEVVKLHETIKEQIEASEKQTRTMIRLTRAAIFLAVVQVITSVIQILIAYCSTN
jgi:hypothetical protein